MNVQWRGQAVCALLCTAALATAWPTRVAAGGHPESKVREALPSSVSVPVSVPVPAPARTGVWGTSQSNALLNWVHLTGNNLALPFMVIDKAAATSTVYDGHGTLIGMAPVLIGLAIGDESVPGIGTKRLQDILPTERTTPAGRFPSALGRNLAGGEILWIDYDGAVSMHPVATHNIKERRAQRLASPSAADNRISYGCVNVSGEFFRSVVVPAFKAKGGIVYVLPEIQSMAQTFGDQWQAGSSVAEAGRSK